MSIDRYVVKKETHLGPLQRKLQVNSILEYDSEAEILKIDGNRLITNEHVNPAEAMRMLIGSYRANPENPIIAPIEDSLYQENTCLSTQVLSVLPTLGCIAEAHKYMEDHLEIPGSLNPSSKRQSDFVDLFGSVLGEIKNFSELQSFASDNVNDINAILAKYGYDIELPPPSNANSFSVASILDLVLKWMYEGKSTVISERYSGAYLNRGINIAHMIGLHPHPVVRIQCQNGDQVCMSMVDSLPDIQYGLFSKVAELDKIKATSHQFTSVSFPCVNLNVQPDISWLNGFGVGHGYYVENAMHQTKFSMNESGAHVQSASAMNMTTKGFTRDLPHIIDRPFILWIKRDGMQFPLFTTLLCEDVWITE